MTVDQIKKAVAEAKRFIAAANEAIVRMERGDGYGTISGTKETGKCRRASMDLTRALAEMRRP